MTVVGFILFVLSSGLFYRSRFEKNYVAIFLAGILALVSSYLLFQGFFGGLPSIEAVLNQDDKIDFEAARTIKDYELYIKKRPKGQYLANARARIAEERREDEDDFKVAQKANTFSAYDAYIAKHPDGSFTNSARQKIASLQDEADFEAAQKTNNVAAYETYLAHRPDGRFRNNAREKITTLKAAEEAELRQLDDAAWSKAEAAGAVADWQAYLKKFPKGVHVQEVQNKMYLPKLVREFGNIGEVTSVAFSPDSRTALSGSEEALTLWDIKTGKQIISFTGYGGAISSVAFSSDGRTALSGSSDNTMKLWDIATGREIRTFAAHKVGVTAVAFSPDGRTALSGSSDKTMKLWDITTGREIRTFSGHTEGVTSLAFSPDGYNVLSGSSDRNMKLWDISTGKEIKNFSGNRCGVSSVAFSPDGRIVAATYYHVIDKDRRLICSEPLTLWDLSGRRITNLNPYPWQYSVVFSPDGHAVLYSGKYLTLWDIATKEETNVSSSETTPPVAISPDGRFVLSGLARGGFYKHSLGLWDVSKWMNQKPDTDKL